MHACVRQFFLTRGKGWNEEIIFNKRNSFWNERITNDDSCYTTMTNEIRHCQIKFTSFFFGLAHIMPAAGNAHDCIADDFLDDCAIAAGCEQLALSLPLRILPAFYIPRFLATSSILCSVRNYWQPRVHVNDRVVIMTGYYQNVCMFLCLFLFTYPVKRDETKGYNIIRASICACMCRGAFLHF